MDPTRIKQTLEGAISPYKDYCEGYGNVGSSGNNYILGFILAVGKTKMHLSHDGSQTLDEIMAFDLAEVEHTYLGQINMSTVSSFCGPQGLIWGYDICPTNKLKNQKPLFQIKNHKHHLIDVLSIGPLLDSTEDLFGSSNKRRFILKPGSHVPCANKSMKLHGPGRIYSAIGVGIAKNREKDACLLMEDFGKIPETNDLKGYENIILNKMAQSVVQVGKNQKVEFEKIFVGLRSIYAKDNEIVCALIAAPYFTIAQGAIVNDLDTMSKISLEKWRKKLNF